MRIYIGASIIIWGILISILVCLALENKNLKLEVKIYRRYSEKYLNSKRWIPKVERYKDEIIALKEYGMNCFEISRVMGVDPSTIYKAFKRRGVK